MARGLDTILETASDSSSDESDTTAPAPAPAAWAAAAAYWAAAANGEDANPTKEAKCAEAISTIATEYICPITGEMPIAPVMAKDGRVYERDAIKRWFETKEGDPTSPSTGAVIDTELIPAPQIRNTIEALVKSGAVDGELAAAWKQKLADETKVKEMRAKAEGGDVGAMWRLGVCYENGLHGLAENFVQARAWYERSAAARHPPGMASFGYYLLLGKGGTQDNAFGFVNVTQAAELGSELGACILGDGFFRGASGLPKDQVRARYWMEKVAGGECEYKHLNDEWVAKSAERLRELDD